jgi:Predicted nucleotide-binding protein containing TIR-like domain
MVTKRAKPAAEPSGPAKLRMSVDDARKAITERIELGGPLSQATIQSAQALEEHRDAFNQWDDYNNTLLRKMFTTDEEQSKYDAYVGRVLSMSSWGGGIDVEQQIRDYLEDVSTRVQRLRSIEQRLGLFDLDESAATPTRSVNVVVPKELSSDVFIVHGHDNATKEAVARMLQTLSLKPVILSEQPNAGRTIIERFEHNSDVGFAIVLMTADDVGGKDENSLPSRSCCSAHHSGSPYCNRTPGMRSRISASRVPQQAGVGHEKDCLLTSD